MGRQGSAEAIASIGLVQDATLQSYVSRIGQRLAARSERPQLAWQFHVLDDGAVNAFAMPGGFIFVTRGMLSNMTNEAELASVLGHEIGHVTARHSVQQMSRQQIATIGLGIGSMISPTLARYGEIAGSGLGLLFLKYSRDNETQADKLGFRYALDDGYDTREMGGVFETLQRGQQLSGGGRLPEWQATHPDPGNRITTVKNLVTQSNRDFSGLRVGEDTFHQRIEGLVYGENPRVGFFQGSRFLHPDLKFVMQFPEGWTTRNAPDAVTGVSSSGDAIIELRGATGSSSEAARAFSGQQGVAAGPLQQLRINGNAAVSGEFTAQSSDGTPLRGISTFIEFGGATWGLTTYTTARRFNAYLPMCQRSLSSFDRLTESSALAIQPMRIRIERAPRAMSLRDFNTRFPSSIPFPELAMINGLTENTQLVAGQAIKRVVGTAMPRAGGQQ